MTIENLSNPGEHELPKREPSRRRFLFCLVPILLAGGLLVFAGIKLGCRPAPEEDAKPLVVCTTPHVADLVRAVAGTHLAVECLLSGEGADPHNHVPTRDDIAKLAKADLIVYSGHQLEGKFDTIFKRMAKTKPTLAVAESIPKDKLIADASGAVDPHVWFDITLWDQTITPVIDALSELDPEHADAFSANGENYRTALFALLDELKAEIATIPEDRRILVTSHDAFSYFGRAFEMDVRAVQGISTATEPSAAAIEELVTLLVENEVPAIFVEKSVNPRTINAVIAGANRVHEANETGLRVERGGELYSDSMGAEGTPEGTYAGMMRYNVQTLVRALGNADES